MKLEEVPAASVIQQPWVDGKTSLELISAKVDDAKRSPIVAALPGSYAKGDATYRVSWQGVASEANVSPLRSPGRRSALQEVIPAVDFYMLELFKTQTERSRYASAERSLGVRISF